MDFVRVRQSPACPRCGFQKAPGLLLCWGCIAVFTLRGSLDPRCQEILVAAENKLKNGEKLESRRRRKNKQIVA